MAEKKTLNKVPAEKKGVSGDGFIMPRAKVRPSPSPSVDVPSSPLPDTTDIWAEMEEACPTFKELLETKRAQRGGASSDGIASGALTTDFKRMRLNENEAVPDEAAKTDEAAMTEGGSDGDFVVVSAATVSLTATQKKRKARKAAKARALSSTPPASASIKDLLRGEGSLEERKNAALQAVAAAAAASSSCAAAESASNAGDEDNGKGSASDEEDRKTHASSKLSSTRSHRSKGWASYQRNQARLAQHLEEKGLKWDETKKLRDAVANSSRSMGLPGSVAVAIQRCGIQEMPAMTEEEKVAAIVEGMKKEPNMSFLTGFLTKNAEGYYHCSLCNKIADEWHLKSGAHLLRAEEHALAGLLSGRAGSCRRFQNGRGYQGVLTRQGVMAFWGDEIHNLGIKAMEVLRVKKVFWVNSRKPLVPESVEGTRVAMVLYSGSGKYNTETRYHWLDELVDHADVLEDMSADVASVSATDTAGWWPVVAFTLSDKTKEALGIWKEQGMVKLAISCFYQLLSDRVDVWVLSYPEK